MNIFARLRIWLHNHRAGRRRGHRRRIRQAVRVHHRLLEIHGTTAGETFARRIAYLRKIDPLSFEELVLNALKRHGHHVLRNPHYTGDGGIDGRVYLAGHWRGIQCKRYSNAIAWAHVELFARDCYRHGLAGGYFVHTGRTPGRRPLPPGVVLISGRVLIDLLCSERPAALHIPQLAADAEIHRRAVND